MPGSKSNSSRDAQAPMLDPAVFGRRVRAQRALLGMESVTNLGHAVFAKTGVSISDRSLYMIERGEQSPSTEMFLALLVTLNPDGGLHYFKSALRKDVWQQLF